MRDGDTLQRHGKSKLAQLTRIAHRPSKAVFAARAVIESISMLWQLSRQEQQIELYETLLYRLKAQARESDRSGC